LREYAERFATWAGGPLFLDGLARARTAALPPGDRARLERVAERIRSFAEARACNSVT